MQLGAFSISLAVKDLAASRRFYEALGFESFAGSDAHNYLIMKNKETLIGLFQGMFEGNMLTFNPGWDQGAGPVSGFDDVRDIHARLTGAGIETKHEAGLDGDGVASFVVVDPDGNPVLIDQHVAKP